MRRFFCTFLLFATALSGSLQAAPYYYFEHYTTYEGLPSNTIHCTFQDRYGFVWIGTRDGLCSFDGYDFRKPGALANTDMTTLASMDISEDEDGRLWFSTSDGIGCFDPTTGETESLGKLGTSLIFDLQPDLKGSVWFAGDRLFRYLKETGEIKEYTFAGTSPSKIAIDSYDTVWVILPDGSLWSYDKRRDNFEQRSFPERLDNIQAAEDGHLLASTPDGKVLLVETVNLTYTTVFHDSTRSIRHILERSRDEYWIGTNDGVFVTQPGSGEVAEIRNMPGDPHSLSANYITSLNKDKSGNVWIGTYYNGLNIWQDKQDEFTIYYPNPSGRSMKGSIVRAIAPDAEGNIWFCTEDGGLNRLSVSLRSGQAYELVPDLNMQGLAIDGNDLWVFTFGGGVYLVSQSNAAIRRHFDLPGSSGCGLRTAGGLIYAGAMSGLYVYDPDQGSFIQTPVLQGRYVHSLFEDSRGILWVGTYGNGLVCCDSDGNVLAHLTTESAGRGLTADRITSCFEDSRKRIWITTEGGGICYTDPEPNLSNLRLHSITRANGLTNNVTCAVAEDEDGLLWVSTTRGIVRIDGETLTVHDFLFDRQQIMGAQFSYAAAATTRNGVIYMGNTNGLVTFSPAKMKRSVQSYHLYITNIEATGEDGTVRLHEKGKSTIMTGRIRIKSRDANQVSISFAAPNFSILQQVSYAYTLHRGRRTVLSSVTRDNKVNLSGLQPGHYVFNVGIQGSDTPISKAQLAFDILPPALWSTAAKILYGLILAGMIAFFIYQLEQKRRRDRARHLSRVEAQKQKEIYDAKINFFTNITHEIRTPLSLIKMPLDKLIAEKEYTPKSEKDLLTIQANTDRLLTLTNQLLDLRKMEKNEIRPVFVKQDLTEIVRTVCARFEQMASEQKIKIVTDIPEGPFEVMCVRDSVIKILGNLMSNGVKYTKDLIKISLKPSQDGTMAVVRVDSNGALIPTKEAEKIFEVFYQVGDSHKSKGTGLGLPFARSLAEVHGGQLYLDTNERDCNSFVLELPVKQHAPIIVDESVPSADRELEAAAERDSSRHTLLVVEDSAEMRNYLARELSDDYNVVTAVNGQDAIEQLQKERVDLVVSDIMMPVMDGCQLCNYVKTNMEYSHLPVLLLTAAVGMETRLQTLEVGADGYIEKPFPVELLRASIANLFKNREISYKQFTNSPLTHFNSVNSSKIDEEFMDKLHGIVMKHMAEQDLSIETLTSLIGTSKSTLYRKVKANTGLNINEYIRLCRLKQAAEMLSSQKYRINEVAYMVGFSSPSYFATSFQKQFNISPSAFVKNLKE